MNSEYLSSFLRINFQMFFSIFIYIEPIEEYPTIELSSDMTQYSDMKKYITNETSEIFDPYSNYPNYDTITEENFTDTYDVSHLKFLYIGKGFNDTNLLINKSSDSTYDVIVGQNYTKNDLSEEYYEGTGSISIALSESFSRLTGAKFSYFWVKTLELCTCR